MKCYYVYPDLKVYYNHKFLLYLPAEHIDSFSPYDTAESDELLHILKKINLCV